MFVLPQNTRYGGYGGYGAAAAPSAMLTSTQVLSAPSMLSSTFGGPTSCSFASNTFGTNAVAGGYMTSPPTPSLGTRSLNMGSSYAAPVGAPDYSSALQTYSPYSQLSGMTTTGTSPLQYSGSAYAPLQSPRQFSSTAQWNSGMVGSQSNQFSDLEEKNRLRDQGIAKVMSSDPTEQDSDLMERMADGYYMGCRASGEVPLVSLGCSCGPKLSFKDIGRGAETLPFDWARTKVEAVMQFISTGFAGFFDSAVHHIAYQDETGKDWRAFRGPLHSFWHDDPTVPAMRERYSRRIKRFFETNARSSPVLFVRAVAATSEIPRTQELLNLLKSKFGQHAKLLIIVDFQGPTAIGLARLMNEPNLLLCALNTDAEPSQAAPYGRVIQEALKWSIGQPIRAATLSSISEFQARLRHTDWGMYGAAKVPAFL